MAIPDYQTFMLPVLKAFATGPRRLRDYLDAIADDLGIDAEERTSLLASGQKTVVSDRAHWAKTYLSKAGLLRRVGTATYEITPLGQATLAENPPRIDKVYLRRFPDFVAFFNRSNVATETPVAGEVIGPIVSTRSDAEESTRTPEERIAEAHGEIVDDLREQLIELIRAASPTFFEKLILDLLLAMGYGGARPQMARRLGRSGDGGIDGLINEDALGLDTIYLQAKRYAAENTVGEEAIRGFCGALLARGATKGVFVTTSSYSKSARTFAAAINQQKLILIDGDRLTTLMVQYGVGTRTESTLEIRRLDADYFDVSE